MIFYFSATGNSQWVAQQLAKLTDDRAESITALMKSGRIPDISGCKLIGIVFPVHAWGPPGIVAEFAAAIRPDKDAFIYAAATCGSETGYAFEILGRYLNIASCYSVRMPNNYIITYDVNPPALVREKMRRAPDTLQRIAQGVAARRHEDLAARGALSFSRSMANYEDFQKNLNDRPFFAETGCTGCGVCAQVCPLENISLEKDRPVWHGKCMMCMACINHCPVKAIQYGRYTQSKGRYLFSGQV